MNKGGDKTLRVGYYSHLFYIYKECFEQMFFFRQGEIIDFRTWGLNSTGPLKCGFIFTKYVLEYYAIHGWLNLRMWKLGYGGTECVCRGPTVCICGS